MILPRRLFPMEPSLRIGYVVVVSLIIWIFVSFPKQTPVTFSLPQALIGTPVITQHQPTQHQRTQHSPTQHPPTQHEPTQHPPTQHPLVKGAASEEFSEIQEEDQYCHCQRANSSTEQAPTEPPTEPPRHFVDVERRSREKMSLNEFVEEFVKKRRPVILTGYSGWGPFKVTRQFLEDECGNNTIRVDMYMEDMVKSLPCDLQRDLDCRLREHDLGGIMTWLTSLSSQWKLRDYLKYIDSITGVKSPGAVRDLLDYALRPLYIHDNHVSTVCPAVEKMLQVPKYFAHDFIHCRQDSWLQGVQTFWGPGGSTAYPLHLNEQDVPFYMSQLWGHKAWVLIPRIWCFEEGKCEDQLQYLSPMPHLQHLYASNPLHADIIKYPDLAKVHGFQTILGPNEILYVPEGTAHQVENLDESMALVVKVIGTETQATYVRDLIVDGQFPYCQDLMCNDWKLQGKKIKPSLESFMTHIQGSQSLGQGVHKRSIDTVQLSEARVAAHLKSGICRVEESCTFQRMFGYDRDGTKILHDGLTDNCPIIWDSLDRGHKTLQPNNTLSHKART